MVRVSSIFRFAKCEFPAGEVAPEIWDPSNRSPGLVSRPAGPTASGAFEPRRR